MALRHSYLYHVLKFLGDGRARTVYDLVQLLAAEREDMWLKEEKKLAGPETVGQMEQVLAGLEEIGVVPIRGDNDDPPDTGPPSSNSRDGGGEGDEPGGPIGPEAGDGGAGLSEVLGHAVLFCLSEDTQDALLDTAFSTGPSEEGARG